MAADYRQPDAVRFLSALAPDGGLTFQTFDDRKERRELARHRSGTYASCARWLAGQNEKGAGCFVMVNRGDGKGRRTGNVQSVRAVFLDLDGAPLEPVQAAPIPPPIVCESSPSRFHALWPVAGMPLSDFRPAQLALAERFQGDRAMADLPRVIRLPGYVHAKRDPFTSRLLHCDPVQPWRWPDFAEVMALPFTPTRAANDEGEWADGERNLALYRFACGLRNKGLDHAEALRRVTVANAERCKTPLDGAEVAGIFESAWKAPAQGFAKLPHDVMDSEAFRTLPDAGARVMFGLLRNYGPAINGRLTFTRSDAARWGLDKRRRTAGLRAAEDAGLIECTERGKSATPGHRATPDRFRLLFLP
ncbi:primase alpha helix C-terminal domain-containing protein [Lysobacter olei]